MMHDMPLIALAQESEFDVVSSDMRGYRLTISTEGYTDAYRWNVVR